MLRENFTDSQEKRYQEILWGNGSGRGIRCDGIKSVNFPKKLKYAKEKCQRLAVRSASNDMGIVTCVTCGATQMFNSKEMHGGHFISAKKSAFTALMPENINPQCHDCNTLENGSEARYVEYLGEWMADYIRRKSKFPNPWNDERIAVYMVLIVDPGLKEADRRNRDKSKRLKERSWN